MLPHVNRQDREIEDRDRIACLARARTPYPYSSLYDVTNEEAERVWLQRLRAGGARVSGLGHSSSADRRGAVVECLGEFFVMSFDFHDDRLNVENLPI